MTRIPPPQPKSYLRIEAVMEAPIWALVVAVVLMTIAVVSQVLTRL